MRSWIKPGSVWAALLGAVAATAWGADAPIRNLRIPLDYYADGTLRTQITAGTAAMQTNGCIDASDVKIEMYGPDGELQTRAEAGACFVDREKQAVASTENVRVTQKGLSITGVGFEWQASDQSFKILNEARVVFVRNSTMKFLKLP